MNWNRRYVQSKVDDVQPKIEERGVQCPKCHRINHRIRSWAIEGRQNEYDLVSGYDRNTNHISPSAKAKWVDPDESDNGKRYQQTQHIACPHCQEQGGFILDH